MACISFANAVQRRNLEMVEFACMAFRRPARGRVPVENRRPCRAS